MVDPSDVMRPHPSSKRSGEQTQQYAGKADPKYGGGIMGNAIGATLRIQLRCLGIGGDGRHDAGAIRCGGSVGSREQIGGNVVATSKQCRDDLV
jgi:hypothetical protein